MSPTSMELAYDVPPRRELPPAQHDAIRKLLEETVATTPKPRPRSRYAFPPRPQMRRRRRRALRPVLALAATSIAIAAGLVVASTGTDTGTVVHAATPPVLDGALAGGEPAAQTLRTLAEHATATPSQRPAVAPRRVRTENWWLAVSVDGEGAAQTTTSAVVPVLRERTFEPDGSVHVREVHGEPQFPNEAYRRAWDEQGNPDPAGTVLLDDTVPAQELPSAYPQPLASEPDKLRAQLLSAAPQAEDKAAALFQAVQEVHGERVVSPEVSAATLVMLEREPGIVSLGATTDRAGREAVAVATDSDDSGLDRRHVLMLRPDDGRVLGYEEMLTGDPGDLDVAAPAVVTYTVFLDVPAQR